MAAFLPDFAGALAAILPGARLDLLNSSDDRAVILLEWGGKMRLRHISYPASQAGRVSVSLVFPRYEGCYLGQKPPITVSAKRPLAAIKRDIETRLLSDYRELYAEAKNKLDAHMGSKEEKEMFSNFLLNRFSWMKKNSFSGPSLTGAIHGTGVTCEASYSGNYDLKLHQLNKDDLVKILCVLDLPPPQ